MLVYNSMPPVSRVTPLELKECQDWKILIAGALIMTAEVNERSLQSEEQVLCETQHKIPLLYSDLQDVFEQAETTQLPSHGPYNHIIDLEKGKAPLFDTLYLIFLTELKTLCKYVNKNLKTGLIKHSSSAAASPMMFISKKDRTLRPVIDYRGLNKITVKNQYSLPLITEALDRLSGIKIFSKLNIKDAYHCIRIQAGDE